MRAAGNDRACPAAVKTWLLHLWSRATGSLWFTPLLMSLGAVVLAALCAALDQHLAQFARQYAYLYVGEADSARTVLSTVAGSIMTVAGVAFSVTMVALSLASSQFGPHLLANFMRDPGNQVVLGGFIGTFLFCLLALGTITAEGRDYAALAATVALLLTIFSLALLIYFIHHIASSMQADVVIEQVATGLRRSLDELFPGRPDPDDTPERHRPAEFGAPEQQPVPVPRSGYLQAVDESGLIRFAAHHDLRLRLLHRPGHYVIEGDIMLTAIGRPLDDGLITRLQNGFIIGGHRTAEQDPEFGIHQLVEIGTRALSSGINDPFTAIACIDRLTGALCRIGPRAVRPALRPDANGIVRLELDPVDFAGVVDAAFNQIRQLSGPLPAVSIRLMEALATIATRVPDPERREAIRRQAQMLREDHRYGGHDAEALEQRYRDVEQALTACRGTSRGPASPPG